MIWPVINKRIILIMRHLQWHHWFYLYWLVLQATGYILGFRGIAIKIISLPDHWMYLQNCLLWPSLTPFHSPIPPNFTRYASLATELVLSSCYPWPLIELVFSGHDISFSSRRRFQGLAWKLFIIGGYFMLIATPD